MAQQEDVVAARLAAPAPPASKPHKASRSRARLCARVVVATACFGAAAIAAPAPAQNAARLKARALYADGDKALDMGDVETAQKDFEAAYETLPNAAVLLRIAECK